MTDEMPPLYTVWLFFTGEITTDEVLAMWRRRYDYEPAEVRITKIGVFVGPIQENE